MTSVVPPGPERPLDSFGPERSPHPERSTGSAGPARSHGATGPEGSLGERQAALVAALVGGAPVPPGFDPVLIDAARRALLRKRAGDVARHWPLLAASFGTRWPSVFATWAAGRPTQGALQDGWALARSLSLTGPAAAELAAREASRRPRPVRLITGLVDAVRRASRRP